MKHKAKILKLRTEGKSYREIQNILGCSLSTISFHCSTEVEKDRCKKKIKIKTRFGYEEYIKMWKEGTVTGGKGDKQGHGCVSTHVRAYIFKKFNYKCSKCKWTKLNVYTNTIPLEVDHIDGNSMNHKEDNLDLLCPNCHSLTKGHSTSKGNGRRYYRQKYHNEKVPLVGIEPTKSEDGGFTVP